MEQEKRQQLIVLLRNQHRDEFGITVPLPLDDAAMVQIRQQIRPLVGLVVNQADVETFMGEICYLPSTQRGVDIANSLYAKGFDWHTACHKAVAVTEL